MSDSFRGVKPSSVAAFLFAPQFFKWHHGSHIVPIFIRTIAVMFVQAGLLPQNHPATFYGMEGVKRYKFSDLIGEAWYTLRSTPVTPYQWSLFISIVMMVALVILSFVMTVLTVASSFVGAAGAQVFTNPNGPTDFASGGWAPGVTGTAFNFNVAPPGSPHGDYGIMILDKILREGIIGGGQGGAIQEALGALMQIYNTGVLVIAGVMVFWIVISVVADTAKTGQIGGGRHNMVWAPIRIVFALGLLIPLGSSGFSSGQFMVIKLAEWGSNLGSNGWLTYIKAVQISANTVATYGVQSTAGLVAQYDKMWVCRVAYNAFAAQAGSLTPEQTIVPVMNRATPLESGRAQYFFTNATAKSLCGSVAWTVPDAEQAFWDALTPNADPFTVAVWNYRRNLAYAYASYFTQDPNADIQDAATGQPAFYNWARRNACGFVRQHIFATPTTNWAIQPVAQPNVTGPGEGCEQGGDCGAGDPGSGDYPDANCVKMQVQQFNNDIAAFNKNALQALQGLVGNTDWSIQAQQQGWPGMGIWYHKIESINSVIGDAVQMAPITISGGDLGSEPTQITAKIMEIYGQYDKWWAKIATDQSAQNGPSGPAEINKMYGSTDAGNELMLDTKAPGLKDLLYDIKDREFGNLMYDFFDIIIGKRVERFFWNMADPLDVNTYPIAKLAKLGNTLQMISIGIYSLIAGAEVVAAFLAGAAKGASGGWVSFVPVVGNALNAGTGGLVQAVSAFIEGPLTALVTTLAGVLFTASLILKYYLPLMPFVRVAHAVLTWMISVFEAVVMVPVAAIAHITTEGEGLAGSAKAVWTLWLNILLRPILTVVGFVAAMLVFNTFVLYIHDAFVTNINNAITGGGSGPKTINQMMYIIIYVFVIYTAANTSFKLLDMIPSALMKYMGGHQDHSFDHDHSGALGGVSQLIQGAASGFGKRGGSGGRQMSNSALERQEYQRDRAAAYKEDKKMS